MTAIQGCFYPTLLKSLCPDLRGGSAQASGGDKGSEEGRELESVRARASIILWLLGARLLGDAL
jgi:hypothetical protein